jgi:outer membrane protein
MKVLMNTAAKLLLTFVIFCLAVSAQAEDAIFTKDMAQEHLVGSSYRWRQTFEASQDAQAKFDQAQAGDHVMINAFAREFVARTNEIIYGLSSNLDAVVGGGVTGVEGRYDFYNASMGSKIKAADENRRLGASQTKAYQNDLRFLVLLKYLNAQQFQKKRELMDSLLERDNRLSRLAEGKVQNGVGVPLDLARSQAIVEKDKFKKLDAESSYEKSIQELKALVVDLPASIKLEQLEFHEVSPATIAQLEKRVSDRPEIQVAEHSYLAMKQLKEATDNESKVVFSLYGELATAGIQPFGLVNGPSGAFGLQLTMPLVDGGYLRGKSAEALGKLNSLEMQQKQVQIETDGDLVTAKSQIEFTRQVVGTSFRQVELAKKELEFAEKKIRLGSSSNLELITAQGNLTQASELNIQSIYAYEAAKLNFFHLIADVDSYLKLDKKDVPHG